MTGTLYGLPLSQRVDINGNPLSGALLYLYQANTSIPVNSYQDFALTLLNPNPLQCDAAGMIPEFWLADGSYRARLTTATGSAEIFDLQNVTALGPSTGTGGGSAATVDPTAIAQTGDFIWVPVKGIVRAGWVMSNATTIGSASSGASQRANADTQSLYEYLWTNFPDSLCPVFGGRSGTAVGDFTSNKTIGLLDMRSWGIFGLDDMGNSARGGIVSGTPTVAATTVGAEKATILQANFPNVTLSASGLTWAQSSASIVYNVNTNTAVSGTNARVTSIAAGGNTTDTTAITIAGSIGGTVSLGGSGTGLTTISPGRFGTFYVKL